MVSDKERVAAVVWPLYREYAQDAFEKLRMHIFLAFADRGVPLSALRLLRWGTLRVIDLHGRPLLALHIPAHLRPEERDVELLMQRFLDAYVGTLNPHGARYHFEKDRRALVAETLPQEDPRQLVIRWPSEWPLVPMEVQRTREVLRRELVAMATPADVIELLASGTLEASAEPALIFRRPLGSPLSIGQLRACAERLARDVVRAFSFYSADNPFAPHGEVQVRIGFKIVDRFPVRECVLAAGR